MILDRVTLTGADESVDPADLLRLSREFPFVEWGILYGSKEGTPRYPASEWRSQLAKVAMGAVAEVRPMRLSAHLCSRWVRDFVLEGRYTFGQRLEEPIYARVQLNFHAYHHPADPSFVAAALRLSEWKEIIFQLDEVNDDLWKSSREKGIRAVPLFDTSGGAGILPHSWPKPYANVYCGYAGGLGPDNLVEQLRAISTQAIGAVPVWVDMETRVRSEGDAVFDLDKCRRVLEAAAPFVGKRL